MRQLLLSIFLITLMGCATCGETVPVTPECPCYTGEFNQKCGCYNNCECVDGVWIKDLE